MDAAPQDLRNGRQPFTRSSFDRDYWLSRCEGFRVVSPSGRIGFVADLRFGSRVDRPDALIVRAGFLSRRTVTIPIDDVADIIPRQKRIIATEQR